VAQLGWNRLAVLPAALASHEERHVDGFLDVAARFGEHLAHLARHVSRQRFLVLGKELRRPEQDFRPTGRAASTASATSRAFDFGKRPMRSSRFAGLRFSKSSPDADGTHPPSM